MLNPFQRHGGEPAQLAINPLAVALRAEVADSEYEDGHGQV
ncbi:hypothetical protein [Burkholderia ambifaria]|nr:hypothetical protein [Burkholderia ambifaria]